MALAKKTGRSELELSLEERRRSARVAEEETLDMEEGVLQERGARRAHKEEAKLSEVLPVQSTTSLGCTEPHCARFQLNIHTPFGAFPSILTISQCAWSMKKHSLAGHYFKLFTISASFNRVTAHPQPVSLNWRDR